MTTLLIGDEITSLPEKTLYFDISTEPFIAPFVKITQGCVNRVYW
ncbi:MAG: hypothetical protein V8P98_06745 [Acutalibacteraceae bacterium]